MQVLVKKTLQEAYCMSKFDRKSKHLFTISNLWLQIYRFMIKSREELFLIRGL